MSDRPEHCLNMLRLNWQTFLSSSASCSKYSPTWHTSFLSCAVSLYSGGGRSTGAERERRARHGASARDVHSLRRRPYTAKLTLACPAEMCLDSKYLPQKPACRTALDACAQTWVRWRFFAEVSAMQWRVCDAVESRCLGICDAVSILCQSVYDTVGVPYCSV